MNLSYLPNLLTITRMLVVPPLVWLLLIGRYDWALGLAVFAGLSDLLDGWLARRFSWQSLWGSVFDPLADKFLMVASYLTLGWLGELPWQLIALVIARDLVIVIGGLVYYHRFDPFKQFTAEPTQLSRFNTFCQVFLMWFVLVRLAGFPLPPEGQIGLVWLVGVLVILTLVQYVWIWTGHAIQVRRAPGSNDSGL